MENVLSRHRNLTVLVVVLFAQVVGLAVQVKRPAETGSIRLIRLWAISALTPFEKAVVHTEDWIHNTWRDYFYLRNVRKENQALREQIERMRLEQVRLAEDAGQARRLQALLGFKEQFIQQTLPAQVISTTGSEFSRGVYIDKGSRDGVRPDMPVITPDGIVGKIFRVYATSSLVLMISDASSGAGVILEKSRLQGILRGNVSGETIVHNIMSDEQVQVGERVLTSGGDRIYPKGLPVGTVSSVSSGPDFFLNVRVKPAAQLSRLEEVLVITKVVEKEPEAPQDVAPRQRAADILAERLPTVPQKPPEAVPGTKPGDTSGAPNAPVGAVTRETKPAPGMAVAPGTGAKPATTGPRSPASPAAPPHDTSSATATAATKTTVGPGIPASVKRAANASQGATATTQTGQTKSPATGAPAVVIKPKSPGPTQPPSVSSKLDANNVSGGTVAKPSAGAQGPTPAPVSGTKQGGTAAKPVQAATPGVVPAKTNAPATKKTPDAAKPDASKSSIPPAKEPPRQ